jgi:hypothetical protein
MRTLLGSTRTNKRVFLAIVPAVFLCGIPISIPYSYNYVEARVYSAKAATRAGFIARLRKGLKTHGYTEVTSQSEIEQITHSSGDLKHDLVLRKPLDPAVPSSFFTVLCDEVHSKPLEFIISLKGERSGLESDHKRQKPMIEAELKAFETALPELKVKFDRR